MAGNIWKAGTSSPLSNIAKDRCIPQPGQSKPKYFLTRQGSMYFSRFISLLKSVVQFYEKNTNPNQNLAVFFESSLLLGFNSIV